MESTLRKAESRDIRKGQLFVKLVEPLPPAEWEIGFLGIRQRDRVWDKIFLSTIKTYKGKKQEQDWEEKEAQL